MGPTPEHSTQRKEIIIPYGAHYSAKSSLTQAVYAALGDYAAEMDADILRKQKINAKPNEAHPELVALEGLRVAWSEELDEDFIINDRSFKSLTSSGVISTRGIFERTREIELGCSFVLETNSAPKFDVENEEQLKVALERVRLVPFTHTIPKDVRDPEVLKALTHNEGELSAALM